jgi:hypothetical protein
MWLRNRWTGHPPSAKSGRSRLTASAFSGSSTRRNQTVPRIARAHRLPFLKCLAAPCVWRQFEPRDPAPTHSFAAARGQLIRLSQTACCVPGPEGWRQQALRAQQPWRPGAGSRRVRSTTTGTASALETRRRGIQCSPWVWQDLIEDLPVRRAGCERRAIR